MPTPLKDASLSLIERSRVAAYRVAAADIHRIWRPYRAHSFSANIFNQVDGDSATLIPRGDFTALSVAVRLLFLEKESANFEGVIETLLPIAGAEYADPLRRLRQAWQGVYSGKPTVVFSTRETNYDIQKAVELWLYGSSLHRHTEHRLDVEALRAFDPIVSMMVQQAIWQLASIAIALLSVVQVMDGGEPIMLDSDDGPELTDTLFAGAP